MTPDPQPVQHVATQMRLILTETHWHLHDEPSVAVKRLRAMTDGIGELVTEDNALAVFDAPVLGEVYVFAAAVRKSVDPEHPARHPEHRAMSREAFLRQVSERLPHFHQRQQELLAALEQNYPQP